METPPAAQAVKVDIQDDVVCVSVTAREVTDVEMANRIFELVREVIEGRETPRLIINLEGVRFVCSSVIANLCSIFRQVVTKQKGKLAICGLSSDLHETMRLMRLDKLLPIYEDEQASRAAVSA